MTPAKKKLKMEVMEEVAKNTYTLERTFRKKYAIVLAPFALRIWYNGDLIRYEPQHILF